MRKLSFLLLLILLGCSASKKTPPMEISTFTLFDTISFSETIEKAHYHPSSKTLYSMQTGSQQIVLWRNGKQLNTIGGIGTQPTNFSSLADFTMAPDGSLYVLDSVAKEIKKFSSDGKLLGTMELQYVQQPNKLALGNQQNIFVYDSAGSEIVAYDLLDGNELYRFGKFELAKVDILFANKDYVVAFDKTSAESSLFSNLGQFISKDGGQLVYDMYNNAISLKTEALISKMSAAWLPMTSGIGLMTINQDTIAIVVGNQVRLLKIDYDQVF
ncbi:MAG: hypothetical protein LHW48_10255 [Candidatus Cloacimonetes bacterium]|nr:hypothetical protein [Candidatus Cloacimonadota bacterium]